MSALRSLAGRQDGATVVEVALLAPVLLISILGAFDLGLYIWRWNETVEAARVTARIAAVSDPVSSELATMTGLETGAAVGEPAHGYERVCLLGTATCSGGSFSQAAADRLFYGPGSSACDDATGRQQMGLCDISPKIQPAEVTIFYRASGVDSSGVAGALRPLVTVRISGAPADLITLGKIVPQKFLLLPPAAATVLAEDLRSSS